MPALLTGTAINLSEIVTGDMLSGVFTQVAGLIPVVMPVMVGFIAIRKGISFIQSVLHSA